MSKTNAERQRDYRNRHLHAEGGKGERLNMVINLHAKRALERLAACYGVTQREMFERLVHAADRQAVERALAEHGSARGYYDKTQRLALDVTQ